MSSAQENLLRLSDTLTAHENITHWAVSMRLFGKGDFFHRLKKGGHPRTDTYERALLKLSETWPDDLEWPEGIQRPTPARPAGANS